MNTNVGGQMNDFRLPHLSLIPIAAYVFAKIHILLPKINTTVGHDIDSLDYVDSHMIQITFPKHI